MIDELTNTWMKRTGPDSDVVISSRIRLARNLKNNPFTNQAEDKDLKEIIDKFDNLILNNNKFDLKLLLLNEMNLLKRKMLVEKHLISPELAIPDKNKAVALSKNEEISLMINEEDHFRLQVILPGLQLEDSLKIANQVDDYLESKLDIAFNEKYGYLTACPTNVGTGLRSSVMVHLPALKMVNRVKKVISAISKLGLAVRGLYGEGTETSGNLYQISNQVTLGRSEEEIIENILEITYQIIEQERSARRILVQEKEVFLKDRIFRAYGILKYARKISAEEAMKYISYVRLGIDLGIIKEIGPTILNQLMVLIRPATLQILRGKELNLEKRDMYRAELIRERMNEEGE